MRRAYGSTTPITLPQRLSGLGEEVIKRLYIVFGPLAQLVEQLTLNQRVAGSNPARPTIYHGQ